MSDHAVHEMHVNSLTAWHAGERAGYFNDRELEVLQAYWNRVPRIPCADREIMSACGYTELAKVQPRISDLVAKGVLVEVGFRKDPTTGKRVRTCEIGPPPSMRQQAFL